MGDHYFLQLKCAGCGADNPSKEDYEANPTENGVYFAPSSGSMDFKCNFCGKTNWIETGYYGRIVSDEELKKLYKKEGFE